MESNLRPEVQELVRVCETLARQATMLTVEERETVFLCARELEKTVLPDRH